VAVASGPKGETLLPESELFVLELLPSPPFTHANTATARIKQIKSIRTVSFVIRKFSLKFSFLSFRLIQSTGCLVAQVSWMVEISVTHAILLQGSCQKIRIPGG
jgi:hypothetical protein